MTVAELNERRLRVLRDAVGPVDFRKRPDGTYYLDARDGRTIGYGLTPQAALAFACRGLAKALQS